MKENKTIYSSLDGIDDGDMFIENVIKNIDTVDKKALWLVCHELVTNSVEATVGNHPEEEMPIELEAKVKGDLFTFTSIDYGGGFDVTKEQEISQYAQRGRGLSIIRLMAYSLESFPVDEERYAYRITYLLR